MARPKIGAVIEFETARGLAYAIYTHWHEEFGYLIRAFDGFYATKPDPLSDLLSRSIPFTTFTTLGVALRKSRARIAGYLEVPENLRPFPLFRDGSYTAATDTNGGWWLWNGEKEWLVGDLTPEQWKYPLRGICTDPLVVEKLETGWVEAGAKFL